MPTQKQKPSLFRTADGKSFLLPFVFITSLFLLWGFAHGLLDVLNKHFQGAFTMSKAESGLVQFVTYIAYFLMALPAGHFMKRFGYKKGILCGLALFGVGSFSFIPAVMFHSATPFLIALFVIACGLCFLETAANPYSTILGPPESGAQRLNLSQSFNGLGWILGPLIGGMLIFNAGDEDSFALARPYILIRYSSSVGHAGVLFYPLAGNQDRSDSGGFPRRCRVARRCPGSSALQTSFVRSGRHCPVLLLRGTDRYLQFLYQLCHRDGPANQQRTGFAIPGFWRNGALYVGSVERKFYDALAEAFQAAVSLCPGKYRMHGAGDGFGRTDFALCALHHLLLYVDYVPYYLRVGPGGDGRTDQESLFLPCDERGGWRI